MSGLDIAFISTPTLFESIMLFSQTLIYLLPLQAALTVAFTQEEVDLEGKIKNPPKMDKSSESWKLTYTRKMQKGCRSSPRC